MKGILFYAAVLVVGLIIIGACERAHNAGGQDARDRAADSYCQAARDAGADC